MKLSLVTVAVRVYPAVSAAEKISFNQLHKSCHQRIRQKLVCPVHGEVARENLVKGYEYAKDKFVIVDEADLEAVRLETTRTIELVQFIRPEELDPMFLDSPYYLGPDGPVAAEGFAVVREALKRAKRIGIGRVVLGGKEKLLALKANGKELVFFTLRYANEVRASAAYLEGVQEQSPDRAQVALAQKLIECNCRPFKVGSFTDRYQTAVLELINAKVNGTAPVLVPRGAAAQVISLMDALRQSLEATEHKSRSARNGHKRIPLSARKPHALATPSKDGINHSSRPALRQPECLH